MARYGNTKQGRKNRMRTGTNRNSRVYPRTSTRRQKVRKASTNRMLENQYGVKFKKNTNFSPLSEYMIEYCKNHPPTDEWDLFN